MKLKCSGFINKAACVMTIAAAMVANVGCRAIPKPFSKQAACPENVFAVATLPDSVRRVAVLPVSIASSSGALLDGRETLESTLIAELAKTQRFEVVAPRPELCRVVTGEPTWTGEELLPASFFSDLQQMTGSDAVLLCQLTVFKAHPPLAVGWRMKLVDVRTQTVLWACDEVFDSGDGLVAAGAQHYQAEHLQKLSTNSEWIMRNSPRYFGQYTLAQLFGTLPAR